MTKLNSGYIRERAILIPCFVLQQFVYRYEHFYAISHLLCDCDCFLTVSRPDSHNDYERDGMSGHHIYLKTRKRKFFWSVSHTTRVTHHWSVLRVSKNIVISPSSPLLDISVFRFLLIVSFLFSDLCHVPPSRRLLWLWPEISPASLLTEVECQTLWSIRLHTRTHISSQLLTCQFPDTKKVTIKTLEGKTNRQDRDWMIQRQSFPEKTRSCSMTVDDDSLTRLEVTDSEAFNWQSCSVFARIAVVPRKRPVGEVPICSVWCQSCLRLEKKHSRRSKAQSHDSTVMHWRELLESNCWSTVMCPVCVLFSYCWSTGMCPVDVLFLLSWINDKSSMINDHHLLYIHMYRVT